MLALVHAKVDLLDRVLCEQKRRFDDLIGIAEEREDGAVVARVRRIVDERHAGNGAHDVCEFFNEVQPAAFADIRNAFHDLCHNTISFRQIIQMNTLDQEELLTEL